MTDQTNGRVAAWQHSVNRLVASDAFQNTIVAVIILNAIAIGAQTYPIPGWLEHRVEDHLPAAGRRDRQPGSRSR